MVIETKDLCKTYGSNNNKIEALRNINITLGDSEFLAVIGKSGSGKSTLLNVLGGLEKATSGDVLIDGESITNLNDRELTVMRRKKIGFVFQNYNLIPVLNVMENIILPVQLDNECVDYKYIDSLMEALEITEKKYNLPSQLSGGQQQRVAIARALANKPRIILADEPTGNLDSYTGNEVVKLFRKMNKKFNQAMIVITHDSELADKADRIIRISDGEIV